MIAILLHYFYMCTFAWMFVEGLHIYRMLTEMRNINHGHIRFYYAIGWGIPAIITGETTTQGEIPKHTLGPETEQQLGAGLHVGTCWAEIFVGKFIEEAEEETGFITQYEKDL